MEVVLVVSISDAQSVFFNNVRLNSSHMLFFIEINESVSI